VRGHDHLVPAADARGLQREHQRSGSRCDAHGVWNVAIRSKISFEALDFGAQSERARSQQTTKNGGQFFGQWLVLASEGDERHRGGGISGYASTLVGVVLDVENIYDENLDRVYAFFAYRLGSREDAEDLTQATFERAVRSARRYDPRRSSPITWLLAIAQNLLVDHYRRHAGKSTQPLKSEDLDRAPPSAQPVDAAALGLDPELAAAISVLSEREREVIALRFGADLSGPQIAALKGLTLANVQQILSRSLRRMRSAMETPGGDGLAASAHPPQPAEGASGPTPLTPSAATLSSSTPHTK
jgi:RNA polymerase sigma-70 factor (ECF subfamily)